MRLPKQCEGFLVVALGFVGLFNIQVPVGQTVEAVSQGERIVQAACQRKCLLIIGTRLGVIAPSPQRAESNEPVPPSARVMCRASNLQSTLIVAACMFKFTQDFIGLSTCSV